MNPDGLELRSWMQPLSLSSTVDSKTMRRLGVEGEGWGRVRLNSLDADEVVRETWEFINETEEYDEDIILLDPCSVMAHICRFRHGHRTRP